jgi:fumarylacetoacetate (FAA) hydrolase
MKLATLNNNSRDGVLLIVSRDLSQAIAVPHIARTLQAALDNWQMVEPALQMVYQQLNEGAYAEAFAFEAHKMMAPLPRAYQWADGSAYVNHVELVRKARGAQMPENFWTDPLMYQGGSDSFLGPCDDIVAVDESDGIDLEAEVAIVTDDVPMRISAEQAASHIRLLMLVNDVSLRNLIPDEIKKGFGFFHSKPSTAFSPVAITPDELGAAWDGARCHLPLLSYVNDELLGSPNAGQDMTFDFPTLVAHAAHTRRLTAGTIIGSGTVSNTDANSGSSCLAEKRMLEILNAGQASTPFLKFNDRIKIDMLDDNGQSIFGAIEQVVKPYK